MHETTEKILKIVVTVITAVITFFGGSSCTSSTKK